jgi:hypothetical protein
MYFVIEDFITDEEERELTKEIKENSKASSRGENNNNKWHELHGRRVKQFGGKVDQKLTVGEQLPEFLRDIIRAKLLKNERVQRAYDDMNNMNMNTNNNNNNRGNDDDDDDDDDNTKKKKKTLRLNHVLVNEYFNDCDRAMYGIRSHQDGPLYENFVLVISLEKRKKEKIVFTPHKDYAGEFDEFVVEVPRKSLFVFYGDAYDKYLHGINRDSEDEEEEDEDVNERRRRRISLTFRNVLNMKMISKAILGSSLFKSSKTHAQQQPY